jgi:excisionase family DNA binding protein
MEKALLTVAEAPHRLSLGRATAYQLVRRGELPSVRVGRAARVPVRALDAWITAHTSGGEIGHIDRDDR